MAGISKKAILAELQRLYPEAKPELNFTNPYETLVATMLSAQCTDKQVNKVTPAVFARFPDAPSMAAATVEELYPMVKSCGFKAKAGNIIDACRIITMQHGGQIPDTMEELTALPGVGRKTANVVLSVGFGHQRLAVDTHVFRVANRIGFVCEKDVLKTELALMEVIPENRWTRTHHSLIFHGRNCCDARRPKCTECPVNQYCKYYGEAE